MCILSILLICQDCNLHHPHMDRSQRNTSVFDFGSVWDRVWSNLLRGEGYGGGFVFFVPCGAGRGGGEEKVLPAVGLVLFLPLADGGDAQSSGQSSEGERWSDNEGMMLKTTYR